MLPLPLDVKSAIDEYLKLDRQRRKILNTGGLDAWLFQPHTNARSRPGRKHTRSADDEWTQRYQVADEVRPCQRRSP